MIHAAKGVFQLGEALEACFTDVPLFPAPSEAIIPNLGSALALWLGKLRDGVYKADCFGPVSSSNPCLVRPPTAHCSRMFNADCCDHLCEPITAPTTVPLLGKTVDLTAGGPKVLGPFFPHPRAKAKPPPPSVYEAAGWTMSAWACDNYICKGVACVHGSPGPDYPCCAIECENLSQCSSSSEDDFPAGYYTPRADVDKPRTRNGELIHIPQLDLFRGVPGYNVLAALRSRANAFARLAGTVLRVATDLDHYSQHLPCGNRETRLWAANADYWNEACSYSEADIAVLQTRAAKDAIDNLIPWEEPLYFASSTYCPSVGQNLPPGFLDQKQFRFFLQLLEIRAHNAVKLRAPQKVKPEERLLVMAHAERFQRFAWQFYSHSDIATDEFAHQLFLDTISQQSAPDCCAGAEADEDMPTFKPNRTRKRRPEEAETRPPRKQLVKDEADTATAQASVPAPPYTAATHTAKQETDVDMGQPQSSQPPVPEGRLPDTSAAQEPIRRSEAPPIHPHGDTAHRVSSAGDKPPTANVKSEQSAQQVNSSDSAPPPVRVQKAYPGKQPPPLASYDTEGRPVAQPKTYKEMPRKAIPESCLPSSLPMPSFVTPPPKARPRSAGNTT